MKVFNDTWGFLVQRRLWPAAILLIAAAVAVPMLLSKEPTPPPSTPTVAVKDTKSRDAVLAEDPIVSEASDGDRSGRRKVLGSSKDPFKPKATPTPTPKAKTAQTGEPDTGSSTGSSTGGDTGTSPAPDGTIPVVPKKKKTYELYELTVRFGQSDGNRPPRRDVKRLQALPSNDEPVLIYLGLLKDKKTAVFLLDSGVVAQGDGNCRPSATQCDTIQIRERETEFFDVPDENGKIGSGPQYELDVVKIRKTTTTDAKKANSAKARVSKQGKMILRARVAGDGPLRYRYDKQSGRLQKLSKKAYKAVVAKAARAARAHF
jgi:hypothetical protein